MDGGTLSGGGWSAGESGGSGQGRGLGWAPTPGPDQGQGYRGPTVRDRSGAAIRGG